MGATRSENGHCVPGTQHITQTLSIFSIERHAIVVLLQNITRVELLFALAFAVQLFVVVSFFERF